MAAKIKMASNAQTSPTSSSSVLPSPGSQTSSTAVLPLQLLISSKTAVQCQQVSKRLEDGVTIAQGILKGSLG